MSFATCKSIPKSVCSSRVVGEGVHLQPPSCKSTAVEGYLVGLQVDLLTFGYHSHFAELLPGAGLLRSWG